MTLKKLDQHRDKMHEAAVWQRELDALRHEEQATIKSCIKRREERLMRRLTELESERDEIDDFIDSLQDSQLRQIIHYRYIRGCSWTKVAQMIGGGNTDSAVKMRVIRHFK